MHAVDLRRKNKIVESYDTLSNMEKFSVGLLILKNCVMVLFNFRVVELVDKIRISLKNSKVK
jgi:hypothetical protein